MSVTVLSDERPVARKDHHCNACEGTIPEGDRYHRQHIVNDYLYVYKSHALCDAAYWIAFRELDLIDCEEESVEPDEVRAVVLRFFQFLATPNIGVET